MFGYASEHEGLSLWVNGILNECQYKLQIPTLQLQKL